MANYLLNISKGRFNELMRRVDNNDPANSAIILVPLAVSDTEANVQDFDDLAAVLAGTIDERTTGGWARKVLTDADLAAPAPDDTNNRYPATLPAVTWTTPAAGNNTTGLLICFDSDTAAGTDANIEVIAHCDMVVNTDGNDVILNAGDYARAT